MMRAFQSVMLMVALLMGLPALAHAHVGHDHSMVQSVGSPSQQLVALPSSIEIPVLRHVAQSDAKLLSVSSGLGVNSERDVHHSLASAASQDVGQCSGGCCCSGMPSCGSGACCHSLAPQAASLVFPSASTQMLPGLYASAPSVIILGLDRPPKA